MCELKWFTKDVVPTKGSLICLQFSFGGYYPLSFTGDAYSFQELDCCKRWTYYSYIENLLDKS